MPPIRSIEGVGEFEGRLEDMQGRFNLNNLVTSRRQRRTSRRSSASSGSCSRFWRSSRSGRSRSPTGSTPTSTRASPTAPRTRSTPAWTPPHRTANMPITRASELLVLPEFGIERYRRLQPYVTALPGGTKLNLCTASPELLDALVDRKRQFTLARENTAETRKQRCFPTSRTSESGLSNDGQQQVDNVSTKRAHTSERRSGSLLALPSSPCTVCCIAPAATKSCVPY